MPAVPATRAVHAMARRLRHAEQHRGAGGERHQRPGGEIEKKGVECHARKLAECARTRRLTVGGD